MTRDQLIDHVDDMGAIITRTLAIANVVSTELLSSKRTTPDALLASLVWQIEENQQTMENILRRLHDQGTAEGQALLNVPMAAAAS